MKIPKQLVSALRQAMGLPYNTVRNWSMYGVPKDRQSEVDEVFDRVQRDWENKQKIVDVVQGAKTIHDSYAIDYMDDGAMVTFGRKGGKKSFVWLEYDRTRSYLDTEAFMAVTKLGRMEEK